MATAPAVSHVEVDVFLGSRTIASSYSCAGEVPDQILLGSFINPRFSAGVCLALTPGGQGGKIDHEQSQRRLEMIREAEGKFEISVSDLATLPVVRAGERTRRFDVVVDSELEQDSPIALFQCESPSCPRRGELYALVGRPLKSGERRYGFRFPPEHIQCERRFIPPDLLVLTIDKDDFVPPPDLADHAADSEGSARRVAFSAWAGSIGDGGGAPPLWLSMQRKAKSLLLRAEVVHDPSAPSERKARARMLVHIANVGHRFRFSVDLESVVELLEHLIALEEGGKRVFEEAPEGSLGGAIIEGESRISVARIALTPRQALETLKRLAGGGKGRGA
jgi:hypothetical protein